MIYREDTHMINLQKAYNIAYGPALPPAQISPNYPLPVPPVIDSFANNRINSNQKSLYMLSRYNLFSDNKKVKHKMHIGLRVDKHSIFGNKTTTRIGWVALFNKTTAKLFYGQAYQEPSARLLYGGWQGSGSDPSLKPRDANTWEINLNHKWQNFLASTSVYRINSSNLFNTTDVGAVNIGKGKTLGANVKLQYQVQTILFKPMSLWASYTWLDSKEQTANHSATLNWQKNIDVGEHTLHFGGYFDVNNNWQFNIRGRYYSNRSTVLTNELAKINHYITFDTNINYRFVSYPNIKINLGITNLFNARYYHPGLRSASATHHDAIINDEGVWIGSQSFYNAKISQPKQAIQLSIYWQW